MKKKNFNKKLNLRKSTISNLNLSEMDNVIGANNNGSSTCITDSVREITLTDANYTIVSCICATDDCTRVTDVGC